MADEFPGAEVIATDISAVQPSWTPPNCSFQIDDCQLDWTFQPNYFDFVHMRYLHGGIDDWRKLYRQAFAATKPGGWFEDVECDIEPISENPKASAETKDTYHHWAELFFLAGDKLGRTFLIARGNTMEEYAREAGFINITTKRYKLPIGGWPADPKLKQVGLYNGLFVDQSIDGFAVYPIGQVLGWTYEEVMVLVSKMRIALKDPKGLPYYTA